MSAPVCFNSLLFWELLPRGLQGEQKGLAAGAIVYPSALLVTCAAAALRFFDGSPSPEGHFQLWEQWDGCALGRSTSPGQQAVPGHSAGSVAEGL